MTPLVVASALLLLFPLVATSQEEGHHEAAIRKAAGFLAEEAATQQQQQSGTDAITEEEEAFDQYYHEDPRHRRLTERHTASKSLENAIDEEIKGMLDAVNARERSAIAASAPHADFAHDSDEEEGTQKRKATININPSRASHLTEIVEKFNRCVEERRQSDVERGSIRRDLAMCKSELHVIKPEEARCREHLHQTTSAHDTCRQELDATHIKVSHLEVRNKQCLGQLDQRVRDTHRAEKELTSKSEGDTACRRESQRLHEAVESLSRELTEMRVEIDRLETEKHELTKQLGRLQEEIRVNKNPNEANNHHRHPGHETAHHAAHLRRKHVDIARKREERYVHLNAEQEDLVNDDAHRNQREREDDAVGKIRAEEKQRASAEFEARQRQHDHKQFANSDSGEL